MKAKNNARVTSLEQIDLLINFHMYMLAVFIPRPAKVLKFLWLITKLPSHLQVFSAGIISRYLVVQVSKWEKNLLGAIVFEHFVVMQFLHFFFRHLYFTSTAIPP